MAQPRDGIGGLRRGGGLRNRFDAGSHFMETRYSPNNAGYRELGTKELRTTFLVESLFAPEKLALVYSNVDRAIIGSAVPVASPIQLTADAELRAAYFCERRELGVLNIGAPGAVEVDGKRFDLAKFDCLYVGRGSQRVSFSSQDAANPACFYLLSYPAHAAWPTTPIPQASANEVHLGSVADANRRTIHQYIHTGGVKSCQLVRRVRRLASARPPCCQLASAPGVFAVHACTNCQRCRVPDTPETPEMRSEEHTSELQSLRHLV